MDQYLQEYPHSIIINDSTILPIWIEESFIDLGDVDIQNSPELFKAQNEIIIPANAQILGIYDYYGRGQETGRTFRGILSLLSNISNPIGLNPGAYYGDEIFYTTNVQCRKHPTDVNTGQLIKTKKCTPIPWDSPNCGQRIQFVSPEGGVWDYGRGYTSILNLDYNDLQHQLKMKTFLINITANRYGQAMDVWYPCERNKLVYTYAVLIEDNI